MNEIRRRKPKTKTPMPVSLMDRRPVDPAQLARLDEAAWKLCPEIYARRVWDQIKRMAEV